MTETTGDIVNFGIIGTGSISGDMHAPALLAASTAQLWSVLSRDIERSKAFAAEHSAAAPIASHCDLEKFLFDSKLDAVIVASPDRLHYDHAKRCLEAGKHVLVEKPLAISLDQADDLLEIARGNNRLLGVGFHLRWHAGVQQVLRLIESGEIGTLRHLCLQWTFYQPTNENWRAHDALGRWWSLAGTGSHCVDLARMIGAASGNSVESISGITTSDIWGGPHDETACILMKFDRGLTAQITSSVLFPSTSIFNAYGTSGAISCVDLLGRSKVGRIFLNDEEIGYTPNNPFLTQIEAFASAIISGTEYAVSGEVGRTSIVDLCKLAP